MLQVIISPAKQMRVTQDTFSVHGIPPFAHQTARLHQALLSIESIDGAGGLQALWNASDKLLASCMDTLHEFAPSCAKPTSPTPSSRAASPLPSCPITVFNTRAWHPK